MAVICFEGASAVGKTTTAIEIARKRIHTSFLYFAR